jgi:hypothetical protein
MWQGASDFAAYPNRPNLMKFMAVWGNHITYLPERDTRQEAIEFFEGLYSLKWKHLCWEHEIIEIKKPENPEQKKAAAIAIFLSQNGAEGGRKSKRTKALRNDPEAKKYQS